MAIPKSNGVKTLARLKTEREDLDRREREARREAAIELGEIVIAAGGLVLSPAEIGNLISNSGEGCCRWQGGRCKCRLTTVS